MKRHLLIIHLEHALGLGESSNGSVQRTEHIINGLTQSGLCDIFIVNNQDNLETNTDSLSAWLGERGSVFFCDVSSEPVPVVCRTLRRLLGLIGCAVWGKFNTASEHAFSDLKKRLQDHQYDLIVSRYVRPAVLSGAFRQKDIPVVVDLDDDPLEMLKTQRTAKNALFQRLSVAIVWRAMQRLLSKCAHVWVIKTTDAENYTLDSVSILPNIPVFPEAAVPEIDQKSRTVLFVGLLAWGPNVLGLSRFLKQVWPQVLAHREDAVLRVVGGGANDELRQLMTDAGGVEYLGFQETLLPSYEAARVCICPVYQGAGSKIKILEAMAHNRPVVITEHSFDGVSDELCRGEDVFVAADDSDFARKIADVLSDHEVGVRLASKGYEAVNSKFSKEAFYKQVNSDLEEMFRR